MIKVSNYWFRSSHSGLSEEYLGEWMEKRGNRDELVVATKVFYQVIQAFSTLLF